MVETTSTINYLRKIVSNMYQVGC